MFLRREKNIPIANKDEKRKHELFYCEMSQTEDTFMYCNNKIFLT